MERPHRRFALSSHVLLWSREGRMSGWDEKVEQRRKRDVDKAYARHRESLLSGNAERIRATSALMSRAMDALLEYMKLRPRKPAGDEEDDEPAFAEAMGESRWACSSV
jgi:hypothetical protein